MNMKKIFSLLYLFICSVLCFSQIHDITFIPQVEMQNGEILFMDR